MKVALLGATRGMGRAVARLLAERGDRLFLLGRREEHLLRSARDLEVRGAPSPVGIAHCDLAEPASFGDALTAAEKALEGLEAVVLTAGEFATQEALESNVSLTRRLLEIDFVATVLFCEAARARLLELGGGRLCVLSSVAGDKARSSVVIYGAAKAGLSHYLDGLDHRFRREGLVVVNVKPGFVRTGMTAGLPEPPLASSAEAAARVIVRALDRGTPAVYAPGAWRLVMAIVRRLPRFVLRRASF